VNGQVPFGRSGEPLGHTVEAPFVRELGDTQVGYDVGMPGAIGRGFRMALPEGQRQLPEWFRRFGRELEDAGKPPRADKGERERRKAGKTAVEADKHIRIDLVRWLERIQQSDMRRARQKPKGHTSPGRVGTPIALLPRQNTFLPFRRHNVWA
jgi:hypothetical protein